MSKYQVKTKDKIVQNILKKMDQRSLIGQKKYGDTMDSEIDRGQKNLIDFMTDVQEELMDALLYLESAKKCLGYEIQHISKKFNDNINNIDVNEEEIL